MQRHPAKGQLWVGFSGGLDSTVLLHLLNQNGIPVRAVHVHHGLSSNADGWLRHCEVFARELQVPFIAVRMQVDRSDGGVEQGARKARYKAFDSVMSSGDQMLLGHHGDDQAETFLYRLMRGAGALGLSGMAESRPLGEGKSLLRPLLSVGRSELEAWALEHGLRWIEDESNADETLSVTTCAERSCLCYPHVGRRGRAFSVPQIILGSRRYCWRSWHLLTCRPVISGKKGLGRASSYRHLVI